MPNAPSFTLLAFGGARDLLGFSERRVLVSEAGVTVAAMLTALEKEFPALSGFRSSLRVAVAGEYVTEATLVRPDDEVALIPPVAGG